MKFFLALALLAPAAAWADPITTFVALQGFVGTAAAAFIASNIVTIALVGASLVVGNYQRRKAKARAKAAYNASLQDRLVTVALTDAARSRVYGRVRNCDGILFKKTRGTNSEFYTLIVALAGHEIDAVEYVYFNDQQLQLDANGYVLTAPFRQTKKKSASASFTTNTSGDGSVTLPNTPVSGSVTAAVISGGVAQQVTVSVAGSVVSTTTGPASSTVIVKYQYREGKSFARVRSYLGASSQDLSASLAADFPANTIRTTDKFAGIACLRLDLEYSQEAFPTGVPQVSAVIRGAKVYDPRSGSTAYSQTPAVIARDWAVYPYGGNTIDVSNSAIIAAANVCDLNTTFTTGSGPVTEKTYQCGIVCKLDAEPTQALDAIIESMAGRWGWSGGTLKVVAGGYRAPLTTITEDWISDASQIRIVPQPPRAEVVNAYRPTISNRNRAFVAEPTPPIIAAPYVTADGQQLDAEITMEGVTHPIHASHIAGILLRDQRQSMTVELPCKLHAFQLELFDTVYVTLPRFGWTNKLFEVLGWRFSLPGGVVLTLKETSASIYDPDAGFEELGNEDNSDLPLPWNVETIAGVAVTSGTTALADGTIVTRAHVTWTQAIDAGVLTSGRIEIQWLDVTAAIPAGEWSSQTESGSSSESIVVGLNAGAVYVFRVRAINSAGVRGDWSTHVGHLVAFPIDGQIGGGNLLPNSSFESDSDLDGVADAWESTSFGAGISITRSRVASHVRHGTYSYRLQVTSITTPTSQTTHEALQNTADVSPVAAGRYYVLSAEVLATTTAYDALLRVTWLDSAGATITTTSPGAFNIPATNVWQRIVTPAMLAPTGAESARARFGISRSSTTSTSLGSMYFDSIQLEAGKVATAYSPRADEILPGTVDTPKLADEAATRVASLTTAGPDDWTSTNVTHVLGGVTLTNSTGAAATVLLTGGLTWTFPNGIADGNVIWAWLRRSTDANFGATSNPDYQHTVKTGEDRRWFYLENRQDTIPAGATVTYWLGARESFFASPVRYYNINIRAELIKR